MILSLKLMSSVIVQLAAIAITLHYHTHAVIRSVDTRMTFMVTYRVGAYVQVGYS